MWTVALLTSSTCWRKSLWKHLVYGWRSQKLEFSLLEWSNEVLPFYLTLGQALAYLYLSDLLMVKLQAEYWALWSYRQEVIRAAQKPLPGPQSGRLFHLILQLTSHQIPRELQNETSVEIMKEKRSESGKEEERQKEMEGGEGQTRLEGQPHRCSVYWLLSQYL